MKLFQKFAIALVIIGAVASVACTADNKTLIDTIYAEYPKTDILNTVQRNYYHAYLICTEKNQARLIMIYDSTLFGFASTDLQKDHDVQVTNIVCGKELDELRRLADIGRRHVSERVALPAKY